MNKKFVIGLASMLLSTQVSAQNIDKSKILIAYYSLSGNTKEIAQQIQKETNGDLFSIELKTPYPSDYDEQTKKAKEELNNGTLPPLKSKVENIADYDIVFIGTPVWWGTASTPVRTFVSENDLTGKKVIPFITHGGGGKDKTVTDLTSLCKGCDVEQNSYVTYGRTGKNLSSWIKEVMSEK